MSTWESFLKTMVSPSVFGARSIPYIALRFLGSMRINVVIRHDSLGFSFGSLDVGLVAAEEHVVSQGLDYELNV